MENWGLMEWKVFIQDEFDRKHCFTRDCIYTRTPDDDDFLIVVLQQSIERFSGANTYPNSYINVDIIIYDEFGRLHHISNDTDFTQIPLEEADIMLTILKQALDVAYTPKTAKKEPFYS